MEEFEAVKLFVPKYAEGQSVSNPKMESQHNNVESLTKIVVVTFVKYYFKSDCLEPFMI